ncbi:MAG: helix-turn-helix domain-containing protein [Chloroflexota bacterium]
MPSVEKVMTPREVAEFLQLTPDTIYRYIREGKLVASRFGRQYRIPKRNVDLFLYTTSTVGGGELRSFSPARIQEWLEEDAIDEETRRMGEDLVEALERT